MEFLPECEIKEECGVFGIFNPDGIIAKGNQQAIFLIACWRNQPFS